MNRDFGQYQDLLLKHLHFVLEYNQKVNLTSIDNVDAGILLHIEDSLSALPELDKAPEGAMADIGSGGGFPGIPLAIVSGRRTLLIESINKKAVALQKFVDMEGLESQISVAALRSEEVALQRPEEFAVVTARAVSEVPVLIELASPLLAEGGLLIMLKGVPGLDELECGKEAARLAGMKPFNSRELVLSDTLSKRTIITYQKYSTPLVKLPRRPGMATKRPLA